VDKQNYRRLADQCLERVTRAVADFDPDEVDYAASDGVLKIVFPDRPPYVLNRQEAVQQMWFAAGARAWHYGWDPARATWVDDRDRHDLFENVARLLAEKLGRPVKI
jgi:CyaY protein